MFQSTLQVKLPASQKKLKKGAKDKSAHLNILYRHALMTLHQENIKNHDIVSFTKYKQKNPHK